MTSYPDVLDDLVSSGAIAGDWPPALRAADPEIDEKLKDVLAKVEFTAPLLPASKCMWRAFELPLSRVRVLILGQDPYPNAEHAVGLSFSTGSGGPIPGSLQNIYRELYGPRTSWPADGDLSDWVNRGVMLLNRALTRPVGQDARPKRHVGWWRPLAVATCRAIAREAATRPIAALLWGVPAHRMREHLGSDVKIFANSHPSGMSVTRPSGSERPFRGSEPFAAVDEWMVSRGESKVGWAVRNTTGVTHDYPSISG
ncbi:uracil-DNA glycosylase [Demetria terragena]|uniref:uracil-DNA glycosylase n=1 Tax=Demetria terragena TaxID=63959 RepID=UPI00035DBBD8|nr:uracil-DNA glycosylase [Demetria terragena]